MNATSTSAIARDTLARPGQSAQFAQAPCSTNSCSETSIETRSESCSIVRSSASSLNGVSVPHTSQIR
jgi:hypothetical protein